MPRDAEELLRIAREVLRIADRKLADAADWLSTPDVPMTAQQRAEADAMLRQVEVARAAIGSSPQRT